MPVYVDPLIRTLPSQQWPFTFACHMIADTEIELHAMARRLGLKREWYQCRATLPHYDLTYTKRKQAIRLGAIAIDYKEVYRRIKAKAPREQTA